MLKQLLYTIALIGCATQAMDRPVQDYSRFPEEMKLEIVKNIIKKNDFSFLAKFMEARKENKDLVLKYLSKNADAVIHQALGSADPEKGIEFLAALKGIDNVIAKAIAGYISNEDFSKLKKIPSRSKTYAGSKCYIAKTLSIISNIKLATIMLANPEIDNDCLRNIILIAGKTLGHFDNPNKNFEKQLLEFIQLALDHPGMEEDSEIMKKTYEIEQAFPLFLLISNGAPISVIRLLLNHPKTDVNAIDTYYKMTALDAIESEPRFYSPTAGFPEYQKEIKDLLKDKGAKTYRELMAEDN